MHLVFLQARSLHSLTFAFDGTKALSPGAWGTSTFETAGCGDFRFLDDPDVGDWDLDFGDVGVGEELIFLGVVVAVAAVVAGVWFAVWFAGVVDVDEFVVVVVVEVFPCAERCEAHFNGAGGRRANEPTKTNCE